MIRSLVRNIDLCVTLAGSISFGILGLIGKTSQEIVTSGILAVLALVSVSLLRIRSQAERIDESLQGISNSRPTADRFFSDVDDRSEISQMISTSRTLWLQGWTLKLHLMAHEDEIRRGVANGLHVRILVIEPDSGAMNIAANESGDHSADELSATLKSNLARLAAPISGVVSGTLEVRTLNHVPHHTLIASDPESAQGRSLLRMATFGGDHSKRPSFSVTRQLDPDWHEFFVSQFRERWNAARLYVPSP
jgi:hypothetical protein